MRTSKWRRTREGARRGAHNCRKQEIETMRKASYKPGRLVLRKTYYLNGFFNETEEMPSFPHPSNDGNTVIVLECKGPVSSRKIQAVVKYRGYDGQGKWINLDHKARIYGRKNLADWFQENFQVEEELRIEPIEKNRMYRIQSEVTP